MCIFSRENFHSCQELNLGHWISNLSLYCISCLSMASINKLILICSVAITLPSVLWTEVCSGALWVWFFVDKMNVQTCYYFTCGIQVARLFLLVGFWENEGSHWTWQFRFLDTIHYIIPKKTWIFFKTAVKNQNLVTEYTWSIHIHPFLFYALWT
jgi:hypothetical protein